MTSIFAWLIQKYLVPILLESSILQKPWSSKAFFFFHETACKPFIPMTSILSILQYQYISPDFCFAFRTSHHFWSCLWFDHFLIPYRFLLFKFNLIILNRRPLCLFSQERRDHCWSICSNSIPKFIINSS